MNKVNEPQENKHVLLSVFIFLEEVMQVFIKNVKI